VSVSVIKLVSLKIEVFKEVKEAEVTISVLAFDSVVSVVVEV
jgi:hypothetical protein